MLQQDPALSKSGVIRPFDGEADGTLIGEGIGMLALRRLADAERDGNRIYAVLRGLGTSSDGRFKSIYAPRKEGQMVALNRAYRDADVSPDSIELFEAHGTGTAVGDATEIGALTEVVGKDGGEREYAAIGSVKSQIGHTKAAAGAAGLIKLALALQHKVLPPPSTSTGRARPSARTACSTSTPRPGRGSATRSGPTGVRRCPPSASAAPTSTRSWRSTATARTSRCGSRWPGCTCGTPPTRRPSPTRWPRVRRPPGVRCPRARPGRLRRPERGRRPRAAGDRAR
ncbi:hypothetical protein SHKM778_25830 [Streptomyces sp. KM77-8]|uniref:Ketosynthase family 3 (KS3) domain-containing protein n=1 Tax=Streptomyces haneummycinicus TaxID=3074435 RepID=A0AAT9HFU5_9ACTN